MHDLMGFYQAFRPWFAKCYIPEVVHDFSKYIGSIVDLKKVGREERKDGLLTLAEMAIQHYIEDVRNKKFPSKDYIYPIKDEDINKLKTSKYWK